MTLVDSILYCLNQFRQWAKSEQPGIDVEIDLRHDGIEHGVVYWFTGLMVDPKDDRKTEKTELATLVVNEALFKGVTEIKIEEVDYKIPSYMIALSQKLSDNYKTIKDLEPEDALMRLLKEV